MGHGDRIHTRPEVADYTGQGELEVLRVNKVQEVVRPDVARPLPVPRRIIRRSTLLSYVWLLYLHSTATGPGQ